MTHETPSELLTGDQKIMTQEGTVQFLDLLNHEVTDLLTSQTAFLNGSSFREPHDHFKADFPSRPYDVDL